MLTKLIAAIKTLGSRLESTWQWFVGSFLGPGFFEIIVQFFTEAAVLVAVFPILDTIIEKGGVEKVTWSLVAWSEGIAALLLIAGIISKTLADRVQR